jgi:Ran GTPase-activating protein (RanGAP) involved in mRNA processing and transport
MRLNLPSKYATLDDYVQDVTTKLTNRDPTMRTLKVDDFHYPDVDLLAGDENDYFTSATIAKLLTLAMDSPPVQQLELRFVEMDDSDNSIVGQALMNLFNQEDRIWESISITACPGLGTSAHPEVLLSLAMALDRCRRLVLNHNQISASGFCSLGMCLQSSNTTLTTLHLKREHLCGDHARALFEGMQSNTTVTELVLNFCKFDNEGVAALSECLSQNTRIQLLDLGACYLPDHHVARVVCGLVGHPALETLILTLNSCHGRASTAMAQLLRADRCRLRHLNLSHQKDENIQNKVSLHVIADALRTNTTLESWNLSRNRLVASDLPSLLEALQVNSALRVLDLNSNSLHDDGIQQIAAALPNISGLQALYLLNNGTIRPLAAATSAALLQGIRANHHLQVLQVQESLPHTAQIQYYTALNAGGRRFLLLGTMNSMTETHVAVPLGMWPWILERAQKQVRTSTNNTSELVPDILFHLLQGPALLDHR